LETQVIHFPLFPCPPALTAFVLSPVFAGVHPPVFAKDVYDVLDPAYKLLPPEKDLFEAKQRYMYAVFERVLQIDKGKMLVWSNETTSNLVLRKQQKPGPKAAAVSPLLMLTSQ